MCEANAYLIEGEEAHLIMEAVDTVEPEEEGGGEPQEREPVSCMDFC